MGTQVCETWAEVKEFRRTHQCLTGVVLALGTLRELQSPHPQQVFKGFLELRVGVST